jgi:zinc transport system substrate-binding protein
VPSRRALFVLLALVSVAASCRDAAPDGRVTVVASFYPLAWAAERVGGSLVDVEDLTPPGVEAHDTTLTAGQRADLETADLVLILGYFGFQPDVERAARDARGKVVAVTSGMDLVPSTQEDLGFDPHVWLDPVLMQDVVRSAADALAAVDPAHADGFRKAEDRTLGTLGTLDEAFAHGLTGCRFREFVTTHEAFGYLASRYGLSQLGIEGLTPESEPSAARIQAAIDAVHSGAAAPVVFYEGTDEGKRVGDAVASDIGVPSLPLGTLEFDPAPANYVSVMDANLANLQKGLQCSA